MLMNGRLDLTDLGLEELSDDVQFQASQVTDLKLVSNYLTGLPEWFPMAFTCLTHLDISRNNLMVLPPGISYLSSLVSLEAKNNNLANSCLPKFLGTLPAQLEILNLSGNQLTEVPSRIFQLTALRELYLGANRIDCVSRQIESLKQLEVLHLGGNKLQHIPPEVGLLSLLSWLNLANNQLETLPTSLVQLTALCALNLHDNRFQTLPQEIISLRSLVELSLRNNPLVVHFVRDSVSQVPSLLELSGRSVITSRVPYSTDDIPEQLISYLATAHECVNPRCRGVYFTHHVEHVKFVDFCGKYRLPLMQYLCSPRCTNLPSSASASDESSGDEGFTFADNNRVRRVLLG